MFILAAAVLTAGLSTTDPNLAEPIVQYLESHYPAAEPGAAVLATRDGETVFRGAFGRASLELDVPLQAEMTFCLASITKVFTAVAVMMLAENGDLLLEEEILDYFPNLTQAEGVTIGHLLSHTSGIPSPSQSARRWQPSGTPFPSQSWARPVKSSK